MNTNYSCTYPTHVKWHGLTGDIYLPTGFIIHLFGAKKFAAVAAKRKSPVLIATPIRLPPVKVVAGVSAGLVPSL
ncbi:MAG TPA: hypothetical protein VFM18_00200 [Methanosarcina sp.]|nr:hypothetical protein [Methanosarcina sp.]